MQKTQKKGRKKTGKWIQKDRHGGAKNIGKREYSRKKIGKRDVKGQAKGCTKTGKW